jgi:translocation and assembly module TamB
MNSASKAIRKTIRVIIWITLSFVFLFLIVAALIQIPAVQTKIVQKATTFVSNKTNTIVELQKVNISFPKSIVIEGLYVEDTQKDTLVYAGRAKVNIALLDLFSNKITINSFSLSNATIKLYNSKTDKEFNYNFLTTSFADTTAQVKPDSLTSSEWAFNLDKVKLQNFRLLYHDNYAAMNVTIGIKKSQFNVDRIDLKKSAFQIDEMVLDGLIAIIQQTATTTIQDRDSNQVMPTISIEKLELNNSLVNFSDSVGYLSVMADIVRLKLNKGIIDLESELLRIAALDLTKSDIRYHDFKPKPDSTAVKPTGSNNWKVALNKMDMKDNSFIYRVGYEPDKKNEFNAEHLDFKNLTVKAKDFYYDKDLTKISVQQFSTTDQNGFVIKSMATNFSMDAHSISTNALKLKTPYSTIDADFSLHFSSLDAFVKNYQFSNLKLVMRNVTFRSPDLLYFSQALSKQPFFQNNTNTTTITGNVNGPMKNLIGKNLVVKTGENTLLETDFNITGLPEIESAFFDFPDLTLRSGKKDMMMMAGPSIPENIDLPEIIDLQIAFKGKMKAFETTANLKSSFGAATLSAQIDGKENFDGKVSLALLDLGQLLKDTLFYGPVSLTAEATGQGLDMKTIKAKIKAEATQLYLNKYNYQHLTLVGNINGKQFEGKINLNDENAVFGFDGLVNLNSGQEKYKFTLNMQGADLQKLHFVEKDVRISFVAEADLAGGSINKMNGTAGISTLLLHTKTKPTCSNRFFRHR